MERVMGIEPTYSAWKADILAVESHPQNMVPKARLELARNFLPLDFKSSVSTWFHHLGRLFYWWGRSDSNTLSLNTWFTVKPATCYGILPQIWCHQKESNLQPPDYKSVALPVVLWWHMWNIWLERWDLNPCPHAPKACALPNWATFQFLVWSTRIELV